MEETHHEKDSDSVHYFRHIKFRPGRGQRRSGAQARRQPDRRGRPGHSRRPGRCGGRLQQFPLRHLPGLAPAAPGNDHQHPLRRLQPGAPGQGAGRGPDPAHFLQGKGFQPQFRPAQRRFHRLRQGQRRQREFPALPLRFRQRQDHDVDRRHVAQHRQGVVKQGRPAGVRIQPPRQERHGYPYHGPARPRQRPPAAAGPGRGLGRARLVARRQLAAGAGRHLDQRELSVAGGHRFRQKGAADPEREEGKNRLQLRRLQQRRQGHLRPDRQGIGIRAPGLHRPGQPQTHLPDHRHPLGHRRIRSLQ